MSKEVLGVSPVVDGAPEASSCEPSPAKTPAQVPSPRSTVSAPAGVIPFRQIMEEQIQDMEVASLVPKEPVSYAKSLTLQDLAISTSVVGTKERVVDETASVDCLPSASGKGRSPRKNIPEAQRVVGRGRGIRIRAS